MQEPFANPPEMRAMNKLALLFLLSAPAVAWDFRGHRMVDMLAWEYLDSTTRQWVEECLARHPDPLARDLFGASTWPDRLRDEWPESMPWHFINLPLRGPGVVDPPGPAKDNNVVAALQTWREIAVQDPERRAQAVAFLIHLVADIHQPLHACNYFSLEYPNGDLGGGRVKLEPPCFARNLHQFWDMAGYPPETTSEELKAEVQRTTVHASSRKWDPPLWARESHELAREVAYPFGVPPAQIDEQYEEQTRRVCRERLHLAALRLASTLYQIGPLGRVERPEY